MLEVKTLRDGGQSALDVAGEVAAFLGEAKRTLDLAQYDFNLLPETAEIVGRAIRNARERGIRVRFIYNVDHHNPIPVPPPPEPDAQLIDSLEVESRAIAGVPDLMHHKYVVRDGETVWTGSTNWTDDSWTRQENIVAVVRSGELAGKYAEDFEQLWSTGAVERSGFVEAKPAEIGTARVRAWFTPGHGEELAQRIARAVGRARQRLRICSPVLTSGPVLGTLAEIVSERRVDVAGCLDWPQMNGVMHQWRENGNVAWKLPLLERVLTAPFSAKRSTPYGTGEVHDFMHAKVVVADDTVFTGSYNLSRSGELNAENVLEIADAGLADRLAAFVDDVRALYPPAALSG